MTKVHYGVIDYIKRSWRYKVKRLYCKRDCQTREFQLSGQLIPARGAATKNAVSRMCRLAF